MKKLVFSGSGVALVTPFNDDGVNFDVLGELIDFQLENETDAIVICGTTGEPATMSEDEKKACIEFTVKRVNKRVPVIVGAGSNNTTQAVKMSEFAEHSGADGLLIVTPYYNKTTQRGLVTHFKSVASSVSLPIIMYNVPGRTGLNMTAKTAYELSKVDNIVGIKEASGNFSQIAEIADLCGESLYIYSGNDDQTLPMLALGAKGVISVSANIIPNDVHNMVKFFMNGDFSVAQELQLKSIKLVKALFSEVNPIPVKEAVRQIGFDVGKCRLPLVDVDEVGQIAISEALQAYFC